jgi:hypothetical protein
MSNEIIAELNNSHLSVAFIPFTILEGHLTKMTEHIVSISDKENFDFFDTIIYHKHLENLIINPLKNKKNNPAFLKIYKLKNERWQNIESLNFNLQYHELKIDNNHQLKFTKHNYIVINENTNIGYFIFGFEIISLNNKGIDGFADCNFFRFIDEDDPQYKLKIFTIPNNREYQSITQTKDGFEIKFNGSEIKYSIKESDEQLDINLEHQNGRVLHLFKEKKANINLVLKNSKNKILDRWEVIAKENTIENIAINSFNIKDLILKGLYSGINEFVDFEKVKKPILLHLFNGTNNKAINHKDLEILLYRTVRIKSKIISDIEIDLKMLTTTYSNISFCALMDGASVIDLSKDLSHNAFFNKYFTSFMLALNQREAMIKLNEELSNFTYPELYEAIDDKKGNEDVVKRIKVLKNKIQFFKFKEVIHSVSFYDEISTFYKNLYSAFDIKLLLEDNEGSVKEIHDVLVQVEKNEELKKDARQSTKLNIFIAAVGCLGLFTFFKDFFPFINDCQYPRYYKIITISAIVPVIALLIYLFQNKKINRFGSKSPLIKDQ